MPRFNPIYSVVILSTLASFSQSASANIHHCGVYFELEPFSVKATDTLLTNSIYAVKIADPAIQHDFKEEYHLNPQDEWGGRVALGYDFPCCNCYSYSLSLEYTFFNHENSADVENNERNSAGLPVIAPAEFIDITDEASARFSHAQSKLSHDYDTIDLLAAKNIQLNACINLRFFGGIRYFHLEEHLHNHYTFRGDIEAVTVTNIYDVNFRNDTRDIGPHIGGKIFYQFVNGFGIIGQVAGSLLYGESESKFDNSYSLSPDSVLGETTKLTSSNHHDEAAHFIPALSGKVALAFERNLQNCSSMMLEIGFRGDRYFHAADDVAYQQLVAGDDINSNSNFQDFDLTGFYFSLNFKV